MPRMIRLESPGSLAHVMARGIDGKKIFADDEDRGEFLSRFSWHLRDRGLRCLAWCLMENHYHLLLRTTEDPLSKLMRPLNAGYARWFNKKHERRGYLYQDRFKSILCQDQEYARQLIRYVHLNPLRSGIVRSLEKLKHWKWCGHGYLLGVDGAARQFQDRKETLRRFGPSEGVAVKRYLSYLAESIESSSLEKAGLLSHSESFELFGSHKGWPAVIGDPDFAQKAMVRHEIGSHRKHRQADYSQVLRETASQICEKFAIKPEDLLRRGRQSIRSDARAFFCYRAHVEELLPLAIVARFFKITIPSAGALAQRGKKQAV